MEELYLELFELVKCLENYGFSKSMYSVDGYQEEAICIKIEGENYIVYDAERGLEINRKNERELLNAAIELLNRLSESDEEFYKMKAYYEQLIDRNKMDFFQEKGFPFSCYLTDFFSEGLMAEDINTYISFWNFFKPTNSLQDFLGMTIDEYQVWIEKKYDGLRDILYCRKHNINIRQYGIMSTGDKIAARSYNLKTVKELKKDDE